MADAAQQQASEGDVIATNGLQQLTELYGYDPETGLLDRQQVLRAGTLLLDLSYVYGQRGRVTGQLVRTIDNLDTRRSRECICDAVGRLSAVTVADEGRSAELMTVPPWRTTPMPTEGSIGRRVSLLLHTTSRVATSVVAAESGLAIPENLTLRVIAFSAAGAFAITTLAFAFVLVS